MFASVEEIHIALPNRGRVAVQPGAAIRFGQSETDQQIAGRHVRQILIALLRPAGLDEMHTAVVHVQLGANAAMHLGNFFEHRRVLDCTQPQPAVGFRHETIKQVVLAKLGTQLLKRNVFLLFNLRHQRVNFRPQELLDVIEIRQVVALTRKFHIDLRANHPEVAWQWC